MGMAFAVASVALLIGNPIAGALLNDGSYVGLQAFSGACLLARLHTPGRMGSFAEGRLEDPGPGMRAGCLHVPKPP